MAGDVCRKLAPCRFQQVAVFVVQALGPLPGMQNDKTHQFLTQQQRYDQGRAGILDQATRHREVGVVFRVAPPLLHLDDPLPVFQELDQAVVFVQGLENFLAADTGTAVIDFPGFVVQPETAAIAADDVRQRAHRHRKQIAAF